MVGGYILPYRGQHALPSARQLLRVGADQLERSCGCSVHGYGGSAEDQDAPLPEAHALIIPDG
eukprot:3148-Pyramimonas_sp.AAC.1